MRQSTNQPPTQPPQTQSQPQPPQQQALLSPSRLKELLASIAENEVMDPLVETALLRMADEFAVDVCKAAVELAAHRRSNVLAVKDVAFVLENDYNITVPGFECDPHGGGGSDDAGASGGQGPRRKSARTGPELGGAPGSQQPQPHQVDPHASRMAKLRSHGRY